MAVAIALLAADRWAQLEARLRQPNYRTVTNSIPRPQGEVIRAVFSPTITLVELQSILDEAQLANRFRADRGGRVFAGVEFAPSRCAHPWRCCAGIRQFASLKEPCRSLNQASSP